MNETKSPYMQHSRHDDGRMTREEAIKWLKSLKAEIGKSEHRTLWHYAEAIDMAIKALSAEAEWIPCSERLPSEDGCYLVYMSWEYNNMDVLRWVDGWNCYRGHDGKIGRENEIDGADILAWMPLPTPYKGGEDE